MNKQYENVKDFHKACGHPVGMGAMLAKDRVTKRSAWMEEEVNEFRNATDIVDQIDAIIDLIYFALGTLVEMGVEPEEFWKVVHAANMEKVVDGVCRNADGKIMKPSGWRSPEERIAAILARRNL